MSRQEQIVFAGVDEMDNLVHELLNKIGARTDEGADLDWNIDAIASVREAIEDSLLRVYDIRVKYNDDSLCGDGGPMEFEKTPEEKWPVEDWRYEVENGDTILGYAEWLQHKIEDEAEEA